MSLIKGVIHYPFSLMLMLGAVLFSCAAPDEQIIQVAAASNLSYLFPELKKVFEEKNPGLKIEVSFGSSGKLATQIMKQAPFDIFLAANTEYPDILYKKGFTEGKPKVYARGSLVLFRKDGGLDENNAVYFLHDPSRMVAITNPALAPYGKAAFEYLESVHISIPNERILLAENVAGTVHYSLTGADLGFIPMSALFSEEFKKNNNDASFLTLSRDLYNPIDQAVVVCRNGRMKTEAAALAEFLLSEPGQSIFISYGYERGD